MHLLVHPLEHRRHPPTARLEEHELQPREPLAHSAHQQSAHRHDHVDGVADGLAERAAAVDLVHRHVGDRRVLAHRDQPELAARAGRVDVHARMERDRHTQPLARRPEVVVRVVVERQLVDVRRRAHEHAAQAGGDRVFDLRARERDVL